MGHFGNMTNVIYLFIIIIIIIIMRNFLKWPK